MAMFSQKGWKSDVNYNRLGADELSRHIENLRDDFAGRHEGTAKPRREHKTASYVSGFGMVNERSNASQDCPQSTKDFAKALADRRIREIEEQRRSAF